MNIKKNKISYNHPYLELTWTNKDSKIGSDYKNKWPINIFVKDYVKQFMDTEKLLITDYPQNDHEKNMSIYDSMEIICDHLYGSDKWKNASHHEYPVIWDRIFDYLNAFTNIYEKIKMIHIEVDYLYKLPDSISKFKNLKYLYLSADKNYHTELKVLPKSIEFLRIINYHEDYEYTKTDLPNLKYLEVCSGSKTKIDNIHVEKLFIRNKAYENN